MSHLGCNDKELQILKQYSAVEDFIAEFQELANKKRDIIRKLRDLKEETKQTNAGKNIIKSLGWLGTGAGALLSFTPLAPVGITMLVAGSAATAGNEVHSFVTSDSIQEQIRKLVDEDRKEVAKCQNILTRFSKCAEELSKNYGFDKNYAAAILLGSVVTTSTKALGVANLNVAFKSPQTLANCTKLVKAGSGFAKSLQFLAVGAFMIEAPFVVSSWFVSPNVNDIDKTIESLQDSVKEVSKFIYELSEGFRAGL